MCNQPRHGEIVVSAPLGPHHVLQPVQGFKTAIMPLAVQGALSQADHHTQTPCMKPARCQQTSCGLFAQTSGRGGSECGGSAMPSAGARADQRRRHGATAHREITRAMSFVASRFPNSMVSGPK